jgi:hypothetical protein
MFFVNSDFAEGDGTFSAQLKNAGDGRIMAKVYASGGCVSRTPYYVSYGYTTNTSACWFQATVLTASLKGLLGVASDVIASGCMGWVTIRGPVDDAAGPATSFTGSCGHSVYWGGATGIGATSSAYVGYVHQVGVLMQDTNSSTTANIFLTGNLQAQSL